MDIEEVREIQRKIREREQWYQDREDERQQVLIDELERKQEERRQRQEERDGIKREKYVLSLAERRRAERGVLDSMTIARGGTPFTAEELEQMKMESRQRRLEGL